MEPRKKDVLDLILPIIGIIFVLFMSLHMAVSYENVKDNPSIHDYADENGNMVENRTFNYGAFFSDIGKRLETQPSEIEWVDSSPKFFFGAGFVCLLIAGYFITSRKKFINGKEYGTSEWGTPKQLAHLLSITIKKLEIKNIKKEKISPLKKKEKIEVVKDKYQSADSIFTQTEKICMYNFELNNNTMIIGGSGSGKTRGYVLPNILQCSTSKFSPSIVVTDPKGEILEKVGKYLTDCGYEIRVLNLKEQNRSFCFNPFKYILDVKFEESISSLVGCIMNSSNENKEQKANDPFWEDMAKVLLKSIFYAVYEGFPVEERNMTTVMEMFRWFEVSDDDDRYANPTKLDDFFEVFGQNEKIFERYGDVNNNPALRNWEDFRTKCKGKTAQSVTATALSKLSPFDEEQIRRIFSKDEMELDLVGERKTALFIVLPPTNKTYNFIANVLYTQLFEQLEYCATVRHNQHLPVPVKFILDEFYNTGRIPNFENILSYARSFGIGISIILQSLDQIKEMYEKSWGTVLDNCSMFLYLGGIRHIDTLEYISKLLGKGTFDKKTYSRTKGRQSSSSTSFDKIGRELLDPAEIQKMNKKKCLFFVSGYNPYLSSKFNYKTHKNYKLTSDGSERNSFYYELPKKTITHGEDVDAIVKTTKQADVKRERTPLIELNTNHENVMEMLDNNILNLDFDSGEEVVMSENESEEFELLKEILFEEELAQEKASSIRKLFSSPPIEMKSDMQTIFNIVSEMEEAEGNIDIDTPMDLGEAEPDEFTDDDFLDDTIVDMESIEIAIGELESNMINDGFMDGLNNIDFNILQTGEIIENDDIVGEIA